MCGLRWKWIVARENSKIQDANGEFECNAFRGAERVGGDGKRHEATPGRQPRHLKQLDSQAGARGRVEEW